MSWNERKSEKCSRLFDVGGFSRRPLSPTGTLALCEDCRVDHDKVGMKRDSGSLFTDPVSQHVLIFAGMADSPNKCALYACSQTPPPWRELSHARSPGCSPRAIHPLTMKHNQRAKIPLRLKNVKNSFQRWNHHIPFQLSGLFCFR